MTLRRRVSRHAVALTSMLAIAGIGVGVGVLFGLGYALVVAGSLLYFDIRT